MMMMRPHASLCFLSYNRCEALCRAMETALAGVGAVAVEVIVNDDGSSTAVQQRLLELLQAGRGVSRLILAPPGRNEGVGASFNHCAKLATGDPIVKIDQDLIFLDGWLAKLCAILDDSRVGAVGAFKYEHQPVAWGEMQQERGPGGGYHYVRDFVGSLMAIPRWVWESYGPWEEHRDAFDEDVVFKERLKAEHMRLALPDEDVAVNAGFGPPYSTVVGRNAGGELCITAINSEPLLFGAGHWPSAAASRRLS